MHLKTTLIVMLALASPAALFAQPSSTIVDTILYFQATDFSNEQINVSNPHPAVFSNDGQRLAFSVFRDNAGKVYTMRADGSELRLIYDYYREGCPCRAPFVDISGDGSTVAWTDGTGELFFADFDGSNRVVAADTIPHANPDLVSPDPAIPLAPQLTYDGSLAYFFSTSGGKPTAGLYTVGRNGGGLTRLFSSEAVAELLLGDPGQFYNINSTFGAALAISDDGSRGAFASYIATNDRFEYGHIIGFNGGGGLEVLSDIGPPGNNVAGPLSLSNDGKRLAWLRRLPGSSDYRLAMMDLANDAMWLEEYPLHGTSTIQLDSTGRIALAEGIVTNTKYPLLMEPGNPQVFSPILLEHNFPLNWFVAQHPVLAPTVLRLAFFDEDNVSDQKQLFLAEVNPDTIPEDYPLIDQVLLSPNYVLEDGSTTSTIQLHVSPGAEPVQSVLFNTLMDGTYQFRGLAVEGLAFAYPLFDDGMRGGDLAAGDGVYTQDKVKKDQVPAPAALTVRFFAYGRRYINAIDVAPFYISSEPIVSTQEEETEKPSLQVYPVPAAGPIQAELELSRVEQVDIVILDEMGKMVQNVYRGKLSAGQHTLPVSIGELPSGLYWFVMSCSGKIKAVRALVKE